MGICLSSQNELPLTCWNRLVSDFVSLGGDHWKLPGMCVKSDARSRGLKDVGCLGLFEAVVLSVLLGHARRGCV